LLILLVAPMAMANMHGHLRKALFDSYDSMARPDHLVELESGFTLLKMHLCSHKDVLSMDGYLKMMWSDDRLKWDAAQWNGIKQLTVPWTELWVPDLGIYNGVGQPQFANPPQTNRVVLFPSGKVLWIPQMTIQSVCKAKAKDQEQQCKVKLGPWTESVEELKITPWGGWEGKEMSGFDLDSYVPTQVEVTNATLTAHAKRYDCCEELYQHLAMDITFKYFDDAHL